MDPQNIANFWFSISTTNVHVFLKNFSNYTFCFLLDFLLVFLFTPFLRVRIFIICTTFSGNIQSTIAIFGLLHKIIYGYFVSLICTIVLESRYDRYSNNQYNSDINFGSNSVPVVTIVISVVVFRVVQHVVIVQTSFIIFKNFVCCSNFLKSCFSFCFAFRSAMHIRMEFSCQSSVLFRNFLFSCFSCNSKNIIAVFFTTINAFK
ncbi:hypothetical protein FOCC_FOCC007497 [Frankliniella occidentalis]|nr:hypothetical protein FOCC_FOCC007497 [Frankliniella occidentalis]